MSRPFIPAPNTSQIELIYNAGTYALENVLHTRKGSPFTLADLQAQRAIVQAWDTGNWRNFRHAAIFLNRIKSKALDSGVAPVDDFILPSPMPGTNGTQLMTLGITFAVKLLSSFTGRSARGRLFVPGFCQNNLADGYGNVSGSFAAAVAGSLLTLQSQLATGGFTLCITSYRTGNAWRPVAVNYDVTSITYSNLQVDSQRRRLPGRGI